VANTRSIIAAATPSLALLAIEEVYATASLTHKAVTCITWLAFGVASESLATPQVSLHQTLTSDSLCTNAPFLHQAFRPK
jgi:hypothetical protein